MLRAETATAAVGAAQHQWKRALTVGHVSGLGNLVGHEIPADRKEIGEHDLGDGTKPGHGRAHGGADDGLLGYGRIPDPVSPEFLEQPDGGLEHASRSGNVFAEKHYVFVTAHFLGDAVTNCLAIG